MISIDRKLALNVSEVAEMLGVSRPVVYQLLQREDFPSFKVGNRRLISRVALEEWISEQVQKK